MPRAEALQQDKDHDDEPVRHNPQQLEKASAATETQHGPNGERNKITKKKKKENDTDLPFQVKNCSQEGLSCLAHTSESPEEA